MSAQVVFDEETQKWFEKNPSSQTTVCQCPVCYKHYKPSLGHKCKKGGGKMTDKRKDCPMRHENGNCTVAGGFCTAVDDPICEALHNAFDSGIRSALRAQKENKRNEPLTLDELLQMNGEPVWIVEYPDWGHWELSADAGDYVAERDYDCYGMKHDDPAGRYGLHKLGWLAYRQKPEEGTV